MDVKTNTTTCTATAVYILIDAFNGTQLSRHRSIRAAVEAKHKRARLVQAMPSGPHGRPYLPTSIRRENGAWTAADDAEMLRLLSL